ncbi:MAG: hypothetical protein GY698_11950 [Actinomycetia bacterium]|nr:hypothetical protein [Actinomycetes bacterium]
MVPPPSAPRAGHNRLAVIGAIGMGALAFAFGFPKGSPGIFADELGYLAAGRLLSGGDPLFMGSVTPYHPLTGILHLPAWALDLSPSGVFRWAVTVNAILVGLLVLLLRDLVGRLQGLTGLDAMAAAVAGAAFPAVVFYSTFSLAETATSVLAVALLVAIERATGLGSLGWGLVAGSVAVAAWGVHPRGVILLGTVVLWATVLLVVGPRVAGLAALVAVGGGGAAMWWLLEWVNDSLYSSSSRSAASSGRLLHADLAETAIRLIGRWWYLGLATHGLVLLGLHEGWRLLRGRDRALGAAGGALLVVFAGVLLATSLGKATPRIDVVFYGRYVEAVVPPVLALGCGALLSRRVAGWVWAGATGLSMLASAALVVLTAGGDRLERPLRLFNSVGLAPWRRVFDGLPLFGLTLGAVLVCGLLALLAARHPRVAVAAVVLGFLGSSFEAVRLASWSVDDAGSQRVALVAEIEALPDGQRVEALLSGVETAPRYGTQWALVGHPAVWSWDVQKTDAQVVLTGAPGFVDPDYRLWSVDKWSSFSLWIAPQLATSLPAGWLPEENDPAAPLGGGYRSSWALLGASVGPGEVEVDLELTHAGGSGPWFPRSGAFGSTGAVRVILEVVQGSEVLERVRADLPSVVRPGQTVALKRSVEMEVPDGGLGLRVWLVHEGVAEFTDRGDEAAEFVIRPAG